MKREKVKETHLPKGKEKNLVKAKSLEIRKETLRQREKVTSLG